MRSRFVRIFACAILLTLASHSHAVILYRTATRNTTAPTGDLTNSGWQWEGKFGSFLGTPVAFGNPAGTSFFITALHVGGGAGLDVNGTLYPIDQTWGASGPGYTSSPNSDLRIWKVQGTIPGYASLYDANTDGSLPGKRMVVFGRGTQRGAEVYGHYPSPPRDGDGSASGVHELKGWGWGASDGVESWGTNYVSGYVNGGAGLGNLIYYDFDRTSDLPDESALSNGDSGGGVFVQSGGVWKLAGINFGADGQFKVAPNLPAFSGSIFDAGGMWVQTSATQFTYIGDDSADIPASSYSTDISSNLSWIHGVLDPFFPRDVPEPTTAATMLLAAPMLLGRRRRTPPFRAGLV